jgi:N6-L-threonylcarbamoyladenine synthase
LSKEKGINLVVPPLKYCTDNATMIGAAGYYAYKLGKISALALKAKATISLK